MKIVLSLLLGLLGPHPSIHILFREPIAGSLFNLSDIYRELASESGEDFARMTVHGFIYYYIAYCVIAFLFVTLLYILARKLASNLDRAPQKK